MLEPTHLQLGMRRQCDLLIVSRSSLYYRPVEIDPETLALMRRLDEFYTEYPDLGHRRLVILLAQEGKVVNVKRVRRLRGLMGLEAQFPKPNLSRSGQPRQRFHYLLKRLIISYIYQVWATVATARRHYLHSDGKRVFLLTGNFRLTQPIRVALAVKQYLRS